jgi:undecaprenyl phosphate-alpha-L-ara4FN deformylase
VLTTHAELEGMGRRELFRQLLAACQEAGVVFVRLDETAKALLADRAAIPVHEQLMAAIDGRSGLVATQG